MPPPLGLSQSLVASAREQSVGFEHSGGGAVKEERRRCLGDAVGYPNYGLGKSDEVLMYPISDRGRRD
jgi:hypothetical protein